MGDTRVDWSGGQSAAGRRMTKGGGRQCRNINRSTSDVGISSASCH